jgi:uncharacterized protein YqeY
MSISEKITNDYNEALKKGNRPKISVLRMIRSAIKNKEIEKKADLNDDEVHGILRSYLKKSRESIEQFSKAGRKELVAKEEEESLIVQEYLPGQLDIDEVKKIINDTINEVGAAGLKDLGKVMKPVMEKVKGQADGKLVNNLVREILEA